MNSRIKSYAIDGEGKTINLDVGIYIATYWQGAAWGQKGIGILFNNTYPGTCQFEFLWKWKDDDGFSVVVNGDKTITVSNSVGALMYLYLHKIS